MTRLGNGRLRWAASGVLVAGLAAGTTGYAASAGAEAATTGSQAAAGVMILDATLALHLSPWRRPVECDRGPRGRLRGAHDLRRVPRTGAGEWQVRAPARHGPSWCASPLQTKSLRYTARLSVAGKGEIHVAVADGAECLDRSRAIRTQAQTFTVTGGAGHVPRSDGQRHPHAHVRARRPASRTERETWTGTLNVSGYEFDTTRPTISGATSKTVKAKKGAKSARVTFKVTTQDDTDGVVPTRCDAAVRKPVPTR